MPLPTLNKSLDAPHRIVAMIEHKGNVMVATEHRVYISIDGQLRPMVFEITGDEKT